MLEYFMRLKDNCVLKGKNIQLRNIAPSDATERYQAWMADPVVAKFLVSGVKNYTKLELAKYIEDCIASSNTLLLAIDATSKRQHIGNIKLGPIDFRHRFGTLGIMIGERSAWGKGFGTEAIELLSHYAFSELGLRKVCAGVLAGNIGSKKAFEKSGYELYAVHKEQFLIDDSPVDEFLFDLRNDGLSKERRTR